MRYDWMPDLPDHRDHIYPGGALVLPDHVDIIGAGVPIKDQGQLGSCTGNSTTAAVEIVTGSARRSELMAYYNGRVTEHTTRQDAGCQIRDVVKGIQTNGVCLEPLWPYDIAKFAHRPPVKAYAEAKDILPLVASYERVVDFDGLRHAHAVGIPVVFGFSVPEYFEGPEVAAGAIVRMPTAKDKMIGGHAVVAVGYDLRGPVPFVWVRNSWGDAWGIKGHFKMDARWFIDSRRLVDDMWLFRAKA